MSEPIQARIIAVEKPDTGVFFYDSDTKLTGAIRTDGELFQCTMTLKPTQRNKVFEVKGESLIASLEGTVFRNETQEKTPNGADKPIVRGDINVAGVKKRFAAWERTGTKSGKPFLSVLISLDAVPAAA